MKIIFCNPKLTMKMIYKANVFFESCREILDTYIANKLYITSAFQVDQLLADNADIDDIFVFFNAEDGKYEDKFLRLLKKYNDVQSRIWAIAMEKNPECRRPPEPVSDKQSFEIGRAHV